MKKYTNALVLWWSTLLIDPYSGVFLFLLFINPFFLFLKKWFEEGVRTNKRITMIRKFAGANNPFDTVTVGSVYYRRNTTTTLGRLAAVCIQRGR